MLKRKREEIQIRKKSFKAPVKKMIVHPDTIMVQKIKQIKKIKAAKLVQRRKMQKDADKLRISIKKRIAAQFVAKKKLPSPKTKRRNLINKKRAKNECALYKKSIKLCESKKSIDREKYTPPTPYYKCDQITGSDTVIVNHCFKKISSIVIGKVIGQGTFGTVYKATGVYRTKKITFALKKMKESSLSFSNYVREIEYHYFMDSEKLGPKLYDAFFIGPEKKEVHYIALEYFSMDVGFLLSSRAMVSEKISAVEQMMSLLKKQIKAGLDCSDIKPGNFLYDSGNRRVKITDFGGDFCRMVTSPNRGINNDVIVFRNIFILYTVSKCHTSEINVHKPMVDFLRNKITKEFLNNLYTFMVSHKNNSCTYTWYTGLSLDSKADFVNDIKKTLQ